MLENVVGMNQAAAAENCKTPASMYIEAAFGVSRIGFMPVTVANAVAGEAPGRWLS